MKETILTIKSEGAEPVIFRGLVEQLFIREFKDVTSGAKNYQLYAYFRALCVWKHKFAFEPVYLVDQFRAHGVEIIKVYEQSMTIQQAQDLFDLSKA